MKATARLYLNTAGTALVREGDPAGATLYCAPGDDIPESAAKRFGLIDGSIASDGEALMRVAIVSGATLIVVGGISFTADWRVIRDGEIDEGQLLAILKETSLAVEAALVGDPSDPFVPFPGRDHAIEALQAHIDYDLANGRPHDRVALIRPTHPLVGADDDGDDDDNDDNDDGDRMPPPAGETIPAGEDGGSGGLEAGDRPVTDQAPATADVAADAAAAPAAEVKEQAPRENKEAAPGENKSGKGRGRKAGAPADQAKG